MKTTKAYQTLPFMMGLNKNPWKNLLRLFPCYASPLDARNEHPSKLILKLKDYSLGLPMYIPMTVKQIKNCYVFVNHPDIYSLFVSSSDAEIFMNDGGQK